MMMHDKGLFISNCDEYVIDLSCLSPQKQAEIYAARMKIEESESESESAVMIQSSSRFQQRSEMLPDSA